MNVPKTATLLPFGSCSRLSHGCCCCCCCCSGYLIKSGLHPKLYPLSLSFSPSLIATPLLLYLWHIRVHNTRTNKHTSCTFAPGQILPVEILASHPRCFATTCPVYILLNILYSISSFITSQISTLIPPGPPFFFFFFYTFSHLCQKLYRILAQPYRHSTLIVRRSTIERRMSLCKEESR